MLSLEGNDSSIEEWQLEARKLELQGKQDQADAIRSQLIKQKPVPWEVLSIEKVKQLEKNVLETGATKKSKILLLEYALVYNQLHIVRLLAEKGLHTAGNTRKCLELINRKYYDIYTSKNIKTSLQQIEIYGIDFRNTFNQTLLMVSAHVGNKTLAKTLLESGANIDLTDNTGKDAFQISLRRAFSDKSYAEKYLTGLYYLLSPDSLSIQADEQLIKINKKNN